MEMEHDVAAARGRFTNASAPSNPLTSGAVRENDGRHPEAAPTLKVVDLPDCGPFARDPDSSIVFGGAFNGAPSTTVMELLT